MKKTASLLLFLLVALPLSVFANDFFGLAGIGQFSKKVVSMREGRFSTLVEQQYDFSCGAAAVATILRYAYNMDVSEQDVIEGMMQVSDPRLVQEMGFSLLDVRRYVETRGLRGRGYNVPAEGLAEVRIPTIVLLDIRGYKHFVVLKRVLEDKVYIGDPALGNRELPLQEFVASWNGVIFAIVGSGFDRETPLSEIPERLTARGLMHEHVPVTNSELLDFGFTYADLF